MTIFRFLLFLSITSLCSPTLAEKRFFKPYINSDNFLYSEPVSLITIKKNWNGKYYAGGKKQIGKFHTEIGLRSEKWSISGIYREDRYLNFTTDTADLYHGIENNRSIDRTTPYTLGIDAYQFKGKGLQVKRSVTFSKYLNSNIGISLFKASNLLDGNITGHAVTSSDNKYDFDFEIDSNYSKDQLFDRKVKSKVSGTGVTLDADLNWKPTKELSISLAAKDIIGIIRWKNVPNTSAEVNSRNVIVNETGFTEVNPVLNGIESYKSHYTQSLKPSMEAKLNYDFRQSPYEVNANFKHFEGLDFFGVGLSKQSAFGKAQFNYWPRVKTAELKLKHKNIGFSLGLDDLNLKNTRSAWLSISYQMN